MSSGAAGMSGADPKENRMPEANVNAEIANHLREHGGLRPEPGGRRRRIETVEILEAVLLALVALATALSGYQAARWDGESARAYAESSRLRSESVEKHLEANQMLAYDASTFNAWLQAETAGDRELQTVLEGRFTEEYEVAFDAWLALDPLNDPGAPAGPGRMPEFRNPLSQEGDALADEAARAFDEGVHSRETGEHYVRVTVILAAVLFLVAIGQRFTIKGVQYVVMGVAGVFLVYGIVLIAAYPHT